MTVLQLIEKYISQKTGIRHNTQANCDFVINIIKKEDFGSKRIDKVKMSDAKAWLIKLQKDGRGIVLYILFAVLSALLFKWRLMMVCL